MLATGTSYSAPAAGTYYVQDGVASPPYYVGLAGPANSFQNPTGTTIGLDFTVAATVTINAVDVYVPSGASGNLQIKIRNSANTADVIAGPLTAVNNTTGAMLKVTVPVGGSLAAGTYKMVDVGNINLIVNSAPTYPLTNTDVSITGSFGLGSYAFFFHWEIAGSGSACKRLPVIATVGGGCTSAPVELISFTAEEQNDHVNLNWTTAQEINNHYFNVERSFDGNTFTSIHRVEGNGTISSLQEYLFTDKERSSGNVYYRLAQYDFDGSVQYSQILSLERSASRILVSPNPFSSSVNLFVQSNEGLVEIQWMDLQGKILGRSSVPANEVTSIGSQLAPGIYILEINTNEKIHRQKIIKE